nr:hypothetical protein [Stutzerimonas azotifigens]
MGPRYLLALGAGLFGALGAFCLFLGGLNATDNLPPPAFSNSLCVDEKLNFLRRHPVTDPDLLVIGSSVAWRHFDGAAIVHASPATRPLNGAFCGLHANQAVYVGNWLLDREPSIRRVVMIVDPQDFAGCWRVRDAVFDRRDADAYVYGQASPWWYYVRYFAPVSLVRNALSVKAQRAAQIEMDPLVFSRYGDGPLQTASSRGLYYGHPEALDRSCFAALQSLATRLHGEGRELTVVSTPLHPEWKARHDPDGLFLADFDSRLLGSLKGTPAQYWNADREWNASTDAFVDAIHLRWSAARDFSVALAQQLYGARAGMD